MLRLTTVMPDIDMQTALTSSSSLLTPHTATRTPRGTDHHMRHRTGVPCLRCDMDHTGHIRLESGTGLDILVGHGTMGREGNIFLPTRLYPELNRHSRGRLPLTIHHYSHQVGVFKLVAVRGAPRKAIRANARPTSHAPALRRCCVISFSCVCVAIRAAMCHRGKIPPRMLS